MALQMSAPAGRLRRDLGTLESYAALLGILIGAGVFKVTGQAWLLTGPTFHTRITSKYYGDGYAVER
jgi:hypothetical protein